MGKGTINWDSVEAWQRLVASIIATGVKIDLRAAATYYGTTYDTLENRLRQTKKDAAALKAEGSDAVPVTPSRLKSTPSTPRTKTPKKSALETVTNGRVSKQSSTKKKTIKQETTSEATTPAAEGGSSSDTAAVDTPVDNDNLGLSFGIDHTMGFGQGGDSNGLGDGFEDPSFF